MEPFLKAVGGKRWLSAKLAGEIMKVSPLLYVEPFVGGGAVSLAVSPSVPKIVSDTNPAFIAVWRALKIYPADEMYASIDALRKRFPETAFGYMQARDAMNGYLGLWKSGEPPLELAALVLHVNVRCFNGLWRVNSQGGFNVPWGKYKGPRRLSVEELLAYRRTLASIEAKVLDFRHALDALTSRPRSQRSRIAIYVDPPYDGTFDGYTIDRFDETEQRDLATWLKYLAAIGMRVWATNADTPLIREIYSWARVEALTEQHSVGAKADRRGQRNCLLIRSH